MKLEIDCTGDVVVGDTIAFKEGVFVGSYRNPSFLSEREIIARVVKDSYGADKQQHTFTMTVLESAGYDPLPTGKSIRRKGRNVYRNGTRRAEWADESQRLAALDEKHGRGESARADRDSRREMMAY